MTCPSCGSEKKVKDYIHGEVYCRVCGLVLEDVIFDFGPEWRAFDREDSDKRERTGGLLRYGKLTKGLTTEIDKYDRDIKGRAIPVDEKAKLYRLRKWQKRSRMATSLQRNLSIALPEIDRMCSFLSIPKNLQEECARLYRICAKKGVVKGRSIEGMVAAVIYIITRQHHNPVTLEELEEAAGISKKKIGKSFKKIRQNIEVKIPLISPEDYVSRMGSRLNASGKTMARAYGIVTQANELNITTGRVPTSIAAAAIYLAAEELSDKGVAKRIQDVPGASKNIIRKRKEELKKRVIDAKLVKKKSS